jgi:hypothetical protein
LCGGGEAAGHADAQWRELADQLAERRILPSDAADIGHAQILQPYEVIISHGAMRL